MCSVSPEIKAACADMILTDAIEDMAKDKGITVAEARDRMFSSKAVEVLYDFDSELWKEGPDYFRYYYEQVERYQTQLAQAGQQA